MPVHLAFFPCLKPMAASFTMTHKIRTTGWPATATVNSLLFLVLNVFVLANSSSVLRDSNQNGGSEVSDLQAIITIKSDQLMKELTSMNN
jgi:hypothetical protein